MDIATQLLTLYWAVRIDFYARRIARCIIPELQQAVLRKFGDKDYHGTEVKAYLGSRAAQMSPATCGRSAAIQPANSQPVGK